MQFISEKSFFIFHQPFPIFLRQHLLNRQSLQRIHSQQILYQIFALLRQIRVNVLEMTSLYLLKQLSLALSSKGIVSLQHHIKQNPQRPHICIDWTVIYLRHYFRSHISRSTTKRIYSTCLLATQTEPKINQF